MIASGPLLIPLRPNMVLDLSYSQGLIPGLPRFGGLTPHPVGQGMMAQIALLLLWSQPFERRWVNRCAWLLGLGVAFNIDTIVPALERLLGASFLPQDIYLISRMPSDPQQGDIVPVAVISLVLAFLATLYPSWRASRVNPAEALRYE